MGQNLTPSANNTIESFSPSPSGDMKSIDPQDFAASHPLAQSTWHNLPAREATHFGERVMMGGGPTIRSLDPDTAANAAGFNRPAKPNGDSPQTGQERPNSRQGGF